MGTRLSRLVVAAVSTWAACAQAQLYVPSQGSGAVSTTLQVVTDHNHLNSEGDAIAPGRITTNSMVLKLDYGLTDRLAATLTAPFLEKKFRGSGAHNPDPFNEDHDDREHIERLDDGQFHSTWQDWGVGLRYRWREQPLAITSFLNYSWPSQDYTYFAHAAPGTGQKRTQIGVFAGRGFGPPWINTYAQASYSYTFVEKVLDINVNYSTLNLELGYHFSPNLSARVFAAWRKTHGGLEFPSDFPSRSDERWLHHDQIQRVDYLNGGLGLAWRFNERYSLTLDYLNTLWGENGHEIHNAVALAMYRGF